MNRKRYRVAQWATGDSGMQCLRAIIGHPWLDLVALRVYSDTKAGRDAGDLCGLAPTGVIATQDVEEIIAARPDCVSYMPGYAEIDVLCRLLEAGCNIVTARTEFNCREAIVPEVRSKLEAACARGQASLYCTGSTPGWFTEQLPLALSLLQRRIDCITLTDYADMSDYDSPQMIFDILPFGADPVKLADAVTAGTTKIAPGSLLMTATALGLRIDEFVTHNDIALARNRVEIAAGVVEAGTVGAFSRSISGLRHGEPVIRRVSILYVTSDVAPDWNLRPSGQLMRIDGDTPLEVSFVNPVPAGEKQHGSSGLTANPVVNAIPYICAAPPGIVETAELPVMMGWFGD